MANTTSAKKAVRQIERRTSRNKARRSQMRTYVRKVEEAIAQGDKEQALGAFRQAEPSIMRAAQKKILHKRAGARKVSRLAHHIAKMPK